MEEGTGSRSSWRVVATDLSCLRVMMMMMMNTNEAGAAAEMAASRKEDKYVDLGARYIVEPIAVETLGVFNASARHLLADLGTLEGGSPSILARLERPAIYFKGFLFWCSALMLFVA